MADLLEQGVRWLGTMRVKHLSRTVLYSRGDDEAWVSAGIGRTDFQVADDAGALVDWQSRDFLIEAAALVLAGKRVLPRRGDRITESQDGRAFIYEVMAPGNGPVWRYSDPYRRTLRIHSKQVDVENG